MFRTASTVDMLKPIATIVGLAIILWSLGLPSIRFAEAVNLTDVKDTLSDSAPGQPSNHSIQFVSPTGVANTEDIVIDFTDFGLSYIGEEDIDLVVNGSNVTNANWSVATTSNTVTISIDTGSIAADATTTVLIGLHATNEGSPNSRISNPAAEGSYPIGITAGTQDEGEARVVILTPVTITATVNTIFEFEVDGVNAGGTVNGETITGVTGSTSIPFGILEAGAPNATTSAQLLTVRTNAANGYVVTVEVDQPLQSTTGAIIDGFDDGSNTNTPTTWNSPAGTLGLTNTYGHWGITSDDSDIDSRGVDQFGASEFIAASTTPREIMQHDGPVNGAGVGQGTTTVGFKVEITALQEAASDYSTTLTYIATPTF